MIIWINGPYGVGKSTLAKKMHELIPQSFIFSAEWVGNVVRDNAPKELFDGAIYERYPMWFKICSELLADISDRYDGDIYVDMTLVFPDSFEKMAGPLREKGIPVKHILLESSYEIIHSRILERGEDEECWCMKHIDFCLENQKNFTDVIRIKSYGKTVDELASEVLKSET